MSIVRLRTVREAVHQLKKGEVVIYPTETSYGLGVDSINSFAIKKIYRLKGRNKRKPLSLVVDTLVTAKKYVKFSNLALRTAEKYWPGPITLILPSKNLIFAKRLGSVDGAIAIRVSANRTAQALARGLGRPLTATSANKSGASEIYSARVIERVFGRDDSPVYFLGQGTLPRRRPSTIARVQEDKVFVIRPGKIRI